MKSIALSILTVLLAFYHAEIHAQAQNHNREVEDNITGIQIGFYGVDIYNETKILKQTTIRAELSLYSAVLAGPFFPKTGFVLFPAVSVQPKYYYNIDRRIKKGKKIDNNSGNYIGLQLRLIPDWFVISNYDNILVTSQIGIMPIYGIRRSFLKHFNYEFRVGLGYGTTLGKNHNLSGAIMDISFKIGYDF